MHGFTLSLVTHALPVWFLVVGLFLPRIALLVRWWDLQHGDVRSVGLVPLVASVLVPRIVFLFLIYNDAGITGWFLLHAVALVITWGGFSRRQMNRGRRSTDV